MPARVRGFGRRRASEERTGATSPGRRRFLELSGATALAVGLPRRPPHAAAAPARELGPASASASQLTLFLCGDVMTGRGIDQILPRPCDPRIFEPYMTSALGYVELAEAVSGPIARPVDPAYVWGEALAELEARAPAARIVNLETSLTTSADAVPKGINYRMHPDNLPCLLAAGIDCCGLANNHVLDWGVAGLVETLAVLERAGLASAGAGRDVDAAERPASLKLPGVGRLLVFAVGSPTSGIPSAWAAGPGRPGVSLVPELTPGAADALAERIRRSRGPRDLVLVSIHWGGNWGYEVPGSQQQFARRLIDAGAADVVHGHSSHHAKAIEVHAGRLILYGCGDFVNDYEGISGHEAYRGDLAVAYFATLKAASGELARLEMTPYRSRRLRLERASRQDTVWLRERLDAESRRLGARVELTRDATLSLAWG